MNHLFSVLNYTQFGTGPLTVFGGVEVGENSYWQICFELSVVVDFCSKGLAWVPTKFSNKSKDWPGL